MAVRYRIRCALYATHNRDSTAPTSSLPITIIAGCSGCQVSVNQPHTLIKLPERTFGWRIERDEASYVERRKREVGAKYGVKGDDYAQT